MKTSIKKGVKGLAKLLGYQVIGQQGGFLVRRVGTRTVSDPYGGQFIAYPPPADFDNVALVLEYFSTARPGSVFVQVGANDGQTSDSVNSFVKRGTMRSVLIEPMPDNFRKLKRFYEGVPNVDLVQAAIATEPGSTTIYAVRDAGRWKGNVWATQLASFDRDHLLRHGIKADEIETSNVECLDLATMMQQRGVDQIDVLQVDVEGYDAEVVKMALALPVPPLVICFEFIQFIKHMDQAQVNGFYQLLSGHGYAWSHDRINTMAVHERFVRSGEPALRDG